MSANCYSVDIFLPINFEYFKNKECISSQLSQYEDQSLHNSDCHIDFTSHEKRAFLLELKKGLSNIIYNPNSGPLSFKVLSLPYFSSCNDQRAQVIRNFKNTGLAIQKHLNPLPP